MAHDAINSTVTTQSTGATQSHTVPFERLLPPAGFDSTGYFILALAMMVIFAKAVLGKQE